MQNRQGDECDRLHWAGNVKLWTEEATDELLPGSQYDLTGIVPEYDPDDIPASQRDLDQYL